MAINSLLAKLGTSDAIEPRLNLEELVADFDLAKFGRAPPHFDPVELTALNANLLHLTPYAAVAHRLPEGAGQAFWEAVRTRVGGELEEARAALAERELALERQRLLAGLPDAAELERVQRYESHLARQFTKALHELQRLQAARRSGYAAIPAALLQSDVKHARGVYPIAEFYFDYTWSVNDAPLEVNIGQIPLPNLREGEALSGDYGVVQSITFTVINPDGAPAQIALYQNPRGGAATGTYLIDRVLVQSHAAPAFSKYKLRQYVVPARGYVRISMITMPEGGSSYPVRIIVAPDDGSVAPGAPGSPVY